MSKRAEQAALKAYPSNKKVFCKAVQKILQEAYQEGYVQAEKEITERIREQVERWMPDNPEGDEYLNGERVAFRSVLHLLEAMEEEL